MPFGDGLRAIIQQHHRSADHAQQSSTTFQRHVVVHPHGATTNLEPAYGLDGRSGPISACGAKLRARTRVRLSLSKICPRVSEPRAAQNPACEKLSFPRGAGWQTPALKHPLRFPPHTRRFPERMETALIQIYPMIPTERPKQVTPPYGRFFLACICAVLILAIIGGAALCATSLAEIKRHHDAAGRA